MVLTLLVEVVPELVRGQEEEPNFVNLLGLGLIVHHYQVVVGQIHEWVLMGLASRQMVYCSLLGYLEFSLNFSILFLNVA